MTPAERFQRDLRRHYRREAISKVVGALVGNVLYWGLAAAVVIGVAKLMGAV